MELIGEMEGSGYKEAPSLVRRADGQVIQLTPLLYSVADLSDGQHSLDEIADAVSRDIGRRVSPENVATLVDKKLRPLGVLAAADGSSPPTKKANPLLALNLRAAVIPEGLSNKLAALFHPAFWPPVVLAVLAGLIVGDIWLFGQHGIAQAIRTGIAHPASFLPLFGAVVLSAALHEIGHAAACRYGGGKPGQMGCGLYLAWPAFYTDVTDAYRLGKRGRLRTDLGGVYFNVIVILATFGVYFATGNETVLLLVVLQHFEIVHQLLPIVRLDGYYIVADMTGVPDLFARIGPILKSMLPWKRSDERVTVLKPWVRAAVTLWVLIVVPALALQLLMVLIHLPRIIGTAIESAGSQIDGIQAALSGPDFVGLLSGVLQLVVLTIPVIGIVYMLFNVGRRLATSAWTRTEGRPVARSVTVLAGSAFALLLLAAWIPTGNYDPIRKGERGTFSEGVAAVRQLPKGDGPLVSEKRAQSAATPGRAPTTTTTTRPPSTTATTQGATTPTTRSTATTRPATTTSASTTTTTTAPTTTTAAP